MSKKQALELAAELGLKRAYEIDPDAFAAALEIARSLAQRIPKPGSFADEPAHICQLPDRSKDGAGDTGSGT